jgi:signal transduction protein with GAF and PtsI domain
MLDSTAQHPLRTSIEGRLQHHGPTDAGLLAILDEVLRHFGCTTGTIHDLDATSGLLRYRAGRGIPDGLLDRVRAIPVGKGLAGLAAQRRQPVQVCNLQSDASGCARPGARETQMEGSIAVPMLAAEQLRGVLGVAKPVAYEFTPAETALLLDVGAAIGQFLGPPATGRAVETAS